MFFLLYVPTEQSFVNKDIEELASELAEQLLEQAGIDESEITDEVRNAVRAQLLSIMKQLQQREQPSSADVLESDNNPETADIRQFLERCYKQSA